MAKHTQAPGTERECDLGITLYFSLHHWVLLKKPVSMRYSSDGTWTTLSTSKGNKTENREHTDEGSQFTSAMTKPSYDQGRAKCQNRIE